MFSKENNHNHPHASPESGEGFFKGMMIGMLFGAGLCWFLGTETGKRAKKQLQSEGNDWLSKASKLIDDIDAEDMMDEEYLEAIPAETAPAAPTRKKRRFFKRPSK